MLAHGRGDEMLDTIFERYDAYARDHQLVLVEGTHEDGPIGEASVQVKLWRGTHGDVPPPCTWMTCSEQLG